MNMPTKRSITGLLARTCKNALVLIIVAITLTLFVASDRLIDHSSDQTILFVRILQKIFFSAAIFTFAYDTIVSVCYWYESNPKHKNTTTSCVLATTRKSMRVFYILIIARLILTSFALPIFYETLAESIFKIMILTAIGWMILQIVYTLEAILHHKMNSLQQQKQLRIKNIYTKFQIGRNIMTVLVVVVTAAAILMSFQAVKTIGISLLASAGFLTALVGLAAQKGLSAMFGGLQLAIAQQIKIGDTVVIDSSRGTIEEITFNNVTVKLTDARRVIYPVSYFIDKSFQNWSRDGDCFKETIYMQVDWHIPVEALREAFIASLNASENWNHEISILQVEKLNEYSITLSLQISANDYNQLTKLCAEINESMHRFIKTQYPDYLPKLTFGAIK